MSKVSRQFPLTEMLHVPSRSPLKLVDAPAGRPDHAAHVGRCNQHREDVAQPPRKIGSEPPAVRVFDEAQQARFRDASNDASIHLAMILDLFRSRRNLCCYRRRLGRVGLWVKLQAFGSTDSKDHPVRYHTLERQLGVDRERVRA